MKNSITTEQTYQKIDSHNSLHTVVYSPIKRVFYISKGSKAKMFTLWREPVTVKCLLNPIIKKQYCGNLSTNLETAVDKALSKIGNASSIYIKSNNKLENLEWCERK